MASSVGREASSGKEAVEQLIGPISVDKAVTEALKEGEKPRAPGMKYRHYAPKAPVTVVTGSPENSAKEIVSRVKVGDGVICFDEYAHLFTEQQVQLLGPSNDKSVQAQRVFDALRAFDSVSVAEIYAQCPDNRGIGLAINNRLKKAAGFHLVDADEATVVSAAKATAGAKLDGATIIKTIVVPKKLVNFVVKK